MLPETDFIDDLTVETEPSETYQLDYEKNRIRGMVDGIDAVKQAIYKILNTERGQHIIYDDDYGAELTELIGKEKSYAVPEIERRITDALMRDDRILSVTNYRFEIEKRKYHVTFDVGTIFGELEIESEVTV